MIETGPSSRVEPDRDQVQRRTLKVVMFAQVLGGTGLAAGVTVGALLAEQMLGTESLAGLPSALFTLGSALTAFLVGRISQRSGRRIGLALGFGAGGLGAAGVVVAGGLDNIALLFVSLIVYGAGTATNLQARYAGADLATEQTRGRSISLALVATTLGAVAGPNLVGPLGPVALSLGLPALTGPFLLAALAYSAAGLALFALLRPDPLLLARQLEQNRRHQDPGQDTTTEQPRTPRAAVLGASIMVLTQITMVAIMTMTPVHMRQHHHGMGDVGLVISLHIAAMFLTSPLTGWLVDRFGRITVAVASAATLLAAGLTSAVAPGDALGPTIIALVLLGLGWNFGLVSGTALVVDGTTPANRPRVQGNIDVLIALAGAGGGALSGAIVAMSSYPTLGVIGGLVSLALVPVLIWAVPRRSTGDPSAGAAR